MSVSRLTLDAIERRESDPGFRRGALCVMRRPLETARRLLDVCVSERDRIEAAGRARGDMNESNSEAKERKGRCPRQSWHSCFRKPVAKLTLSIRSRRNSSTSGKTSDVENARTTKVRNCKRSEKSRYNTSKTTTNERGRPDEN